MSHPTKTGTCGAKHCAEHSPLTGRHIDRFVPVDGPTRAPSFKWAEHADVQPTTSQREFGDWSE